jgi:putative ABC transport system permease protein
MGALLAWWAGRLVRSLLWGVEATDRLTFAAVGSILLTVAVLASLAPALRIVRIKPAVTLREE